MTTPITKYDRLLQRVNATYHCRKLDKGYSGGGLYECQSDQIHSLLLVMSEELTRLEKEIESLNEELQELKQTKVDKGETPHAVTCSCKGCQ